MWLVNVLVDQGMVQQAVYPVYAVVSENQEAVELVLKKV